MNEANIDTPKHGQVGGDELLVQINVLFTPANYGRVETAHTSQITVVDNNNAETELAPIPLVEAKLKVRFSAEH